MALAAKMTKSLRSDRLVMFSTLDEDAVVKQLKDLHKPDGRPVDVKPLLRIIEDVFTLAAPVATKQGMGIDHAIQPQPAGASEEKLVLKDGYLDMLELAANISCEFFCLACGDEHTTALFNMLSSYSWQAKVVISLTAFAVNYGKFWLVAQLFPDNRLANSIAILEQLPEILKHVDASQRKLEPLRKLIKPMLDVTKCIAEFEDLLARNEVLLGTPEMESGVANIRVAVFWTIRSIVFASQTMGLMGTGPEYTPSLMEALELSSVTHKIGKIYFDLKEKMDNCQKHIEGKKQSDAYNIFLKLIKDTSRDDIMKIVPAFFIEDKQPLTLFDPSTGQMVNFDRLKDKNVLLFISDLDISVNDLLVLIQLYKNSKQDDICILWLPVINRPIPYDVATEKLFETLRGLMPWYSVYHPSMLGRGFIKYIKEVWKFNNTTLMVPVNKKGKVNEPKYLEMTIYRWGTMDFSFTSLEKEDLWEDASWNMQLLTGPISIQISHWIREQKHICLYGGENIKWIRVFTRDLKSVAQKAGIKLKMLYVGKSNPGEKVRNNITIIKSEKLSETLADLSQIHLFWVRLQSMKKSMNNKNIAQEINTLLDFDANDQVWVVISDEQYAMERDEGNIILKRLNRYDTWKDRVAEKRFVPTLIELHTICSECGHPLNSDKPTTPAVTPIAAAPAMLVPPDMPAASSVSVATEAEGGSEKGDSGSA